MTGEITLRGRVLPIGGVKEKMLAAHRAGIKYILLPAENKRDLSDIPANVRRKVEVRLVDHMDEVLDMALIEPVCKPKPGSSLQDCNDNNLKLPDESEDRDGAFQH